jgi:hypothetical protein
LTKNNLRQNMDIMISENRTINDVLSDGQLHPIMSRLKIKSGESTSFWISDKPESILQPEDQSEAQCYFVSDFVSEKWSREGQDVSAIGRAAINNDKLLGLITVGNFGYICDIDANNKRRDIENCVNKDVMQEKDGLPF